MPDVGPFITSKQTQGRIGAQHTGSLTQEPDAIIDVHGDMKTERSIERVVLKGQGQGAGNFKVASIRQSHALGQKVCDLDIGRCEVDTRHPAFAFRGQATCRPADAASDIKGRGWSLSASNNSSAISVASRPPM